MKIIEDFKDYEVISTSNGYKYERWGSILLKRPDPEIIWPGKSIDVDAEYTRSSSGGGAWTEHKNIPSIWTVSYHDMKFNLKLMGFKHTGLFPEQAFNWMLIRNKIKGKNAKVLNLFAYTGAATIAALMEDASVVHFDSSKGMIDWAKENVHLNNLDNKNVRFLVDDAVKFVKREIRRGNKYDVIIMDPPSFGRGAKNEVWQIEKDLYDLVLNAASLLSDTPLLFIINSYTTGLSHIVIENILKKTIKTKGKIESDELCFKGKDGMILPCGITTRWENE